MAHNLSTVSATEAKGEALSRELLTCVYQQVRAGPSVRLSTLLIVRALAIASLLAAGAPLHFSNANGQNLA